MATKKVSSKKLLITLGIFAVLLAYFIIFELPREEKEEEKKKIFHFVHADVNKFEITKKDSVIEVERIGNEWRITKPRKLPASKMDVDAFISDVRDLYIEKIIGKNLPDLSLYGLDKPKLILKLWLGKGKNQQMLTLKVGNQNPDKSGYYSKLENSPEVVLLENFTESVIDKELFYFRDKDVFKVKQNEIIKFKITLAGEIYEAERKDKIWNLVKPISKPDLKDEDVNKVLLPVSDLRVKKFYDGDEKVSIAKTGLISPDIKIEIIDESKKQYILYVGKEVKNQSAYYAKREGEDLIFSIDKYIINDLKKDLAKLREREEKKEEAKKEEEKKKEEKKEKK